MEEVEVEWQTVIYIWILFWEAYICVKKYDIYYGNDWKLIVIFHYDVYQLCQFSLVKGISFQFSNHGSMIFSKNMYERIKGFIFVI